jgi:hypothetical protein
MAVKIQGSFFHGFGTHLSLLIFLGIGKFGFPLSLFPETAALCLFIQLIHPRFIAEFLAIQQFFSSGASEVVFEETWPPSLFISKAKD